MVAPSTPIRAANAGFLRFAQESWAELHKVTWPERDTVVRLTVVVLAVSTLVALYILLFDKVFTFAVNQTILGQPGASPTPGP